MNMNRLKKNYYKKNNSLKFIGIIVGIIFSLYYYLAQDLHERKFSGIGKEIQIIDGDTIVLNGLKIRLQGIDSPELAQKCQKINSLEFYNCGIESKEYLVALINSEEIVCTDEGIDKYKRQLSYCYVDNLNINREMVRTGNAIAYLRYDRYFLLAEIEARWSRVGIWEAKFDKPEYWRKNKRIIDK